MKREKDDERDEKDAELKIQKGTGGKSRRVEVRFRVIPKLIIIEGNDK